MTKTIIYAKSASWSKKNPWSKNNNKYLSRYSNYGPGGISKYLTVAGASCIRSYRFCSEWLSY